MLLETPIPADFTPIPADENLSWGSSAEIGVGSSAEIGVSNDAN